MLARVSVRVPTHCVIVMLRWHRKRTVTYEWLRRHLS